MTFVARRDEIERGRTGPQRSGHVPGNRRTVAGNGCRPGLSVRCTYSPWVGERVRSVEYVEDVRTVAKPPSMSRTTYTAS